MILSVMIFIGLNVSAFQLEAIKSVTFLNDGRSLSGTIVDISSRTGMVDYWGNTKIHRNQIWMINYVSKNWNFPKEQRQLSKRADTIFLHNGQVLHARIVDFSSQRRVYEFQNGGKIAESSVKRIYFCCNSLPDAYRQALQKNNRDNRNNQGQGWQDRNRRSGNNNRYASSFMVNGNQVESPLNYINSRKTKFMDGLQINTHDLWLINFSNDRWDFPSERRQLDRRMDTIFLKNGEVLFDRVVDFSVRTLTFRFENMDPIHESQIKRIYFCCKTLPEPYRRGRRGNNKSRFNRRY
jgi:sRNA-binding regulator protein Hfq